MREFFDRLDAGQYNVPVLVVFVLLFIVVTLWRRESPTIATRAPLSRLEAELAFRAAQRAAQDAFADPTMGPGSNEYFFKVTEALDRWEEWQGRSLSTLQDVGCDPTEAEWHALSLMNSIPTNTTSERVM